MTRCDSLRHANGAVSAQQSLIAEPVRNVYASGSYCRPTASSARVASAAFRRRGSEPDTLGHQVDSQSIRPRCDNPAGDCDNSGSRVGQASADNVARLVPGGQTRSGGKSRRLARRISNIALTSRWSQSSVAVIF